MLSPRDAIVAAQNFAKDIYQGIALDYLRPEEVRLSDDEKTWEITLGWVEPAVERFHPIFPHVQQNDVQKLPRVYKVFRIDAESGAFRGMGMRNVT